MDYFSFTEIKTKIINYFRGKLGDNINLSSTEPGGQLVNIGASQHSDTTDLVIDAYNANTVFATEEQDLEIQAVRQGTKRILAQKAMIYNFLVTCDATGTITTDKQIRDGQGNSFVPTEDFDLEIGENRITLIAVTAGDIEIGEDEVNVLVSPVSGVVSVTNDSESIFQNGRNLETIEELRTRLSTFKSGILNTENAIKKAVEELSFVSRATVIEDEYNNNIEVIVEQSDLSESAKTQVAETIAFTKAGGIPAISTASGENKVERTVTIGEKSTVDIEYSLPTPLEIYLRLALTPSLESAEEDLLSEYLEDWALNNMRAGDDLNVTGTLSAMDAVSDWSGKVFTKIGIETSENGSDWSSDDIETTALEIISIPKENVSFV